MYVMIEFRGGGAPANNALSRFSGFTLAEVVITLAIIGVLVALTLPTLMNNVRNKGYVTGLQKAYSSIQNATNLIIAEEGLPNNWGWTVHQSQDNSGNERIVELYKKHFDILMSGKRCNWCTELFLGVPRLTYRFLNGSPEAKGLYGSPLFVYSYPLLLRDGSIVGLTFSYASGQTYYGVPFHFVVDVNGLKGPNQLGRDVFFLYMDNNSGKILPYTNETFHYGQFDKRNTCDTNKEGYSCAYRVITEGKMNY